MQCTTLRRVVYAPKTQAPGPCQVKGAVVSKGQRCQHPVVRDVCHRLCYQQHIPRDARQPPVILIGGWWPSVSSGCGHVHLSQARDQFIDTKADRSIVTWLCKCSQSRHLILEVAAVTPSHNLHHTILVCAWRTCKAESSAKTCMHGCFLHLDMLRCTHQMVTHLHSQSVNARTQLCRDIKLRRQAAVLAVAQPGAVEPAAECRAYSLKEQEYPAAAMVSLTGEDMRVARSPALCAVATDSTHQHSGIS
jgi:hypothetical protein